MAFFDQLGSDHAGLGAAVLGILAEEEGKANDPQDAQTDPGAVHGGLHALVQRFQQSGLGGHIASWIGGNEDHTVAPEEVHNALGADTVDKLADHTGISKEQLLPMLSAALPKLINVLTPQNRLPEQHELTQSSSDQSDKTG
jgi:uncharacterized protein YidB (DUF937 family)